MFCDIIIQASVSLPETLVRESTNVGQAAASIGQSSGNNDQAVFFPLLRGGDANAYVYIF